METKSRYEVLQDLESKKRALIEEEHSFDKHILAKEKRIKFLKRDLDDLEDDLEDYEKSIPERKQTIKALIKSVDDSLNMLTSQSHGK